MAEEQRCVYPLEKINNTYLRWKREVAEIFLKVAKEESFKAVCFKDFFFIYSVSQQHESIEVTPSHRDYGDHN